MVSFKAVNTPEGRVSFPQVLTPKKNMQGKDMFSINLMIPKTSDITALVGLYNEALAEQWPDPAKRPMVITPFKDGDTDKMQDGTLRSAKYPEVIGHWLIYAISSKRVGVVDHNMQDITDAEDFYAGCYARINVHCYTYFPTQAAPQKKNGVGFILNHVQKLKDGESFSGKGVPADVFEPVTNLATLDVMEAPVGGVAAVQTDDFLAPTGQTAVAGAAPVVPV